jgi:hypothetical protein
MFGSGLVGRMYVLCCTLHGFQIPNLKSYIINLFAYVGRNLCCTCLFMLDFDSGQVYEEGNQPYQVIRDSYDAG